MQRYDSMNRTARLGLAVAAATLFTLAAGALRAADLYVSTSGTDTGSRNSWDAAYTNLQDALDAAGNGDTIHVAGQTFSLGPLYTRGFSQVHPYNSVFLWEGATNVTLIGGYEAQSGDTPGTPNPDQWPTLLTRSSGYGRVMAVRSSSNCVIRNITFTNGYLVTGVDPSTLIGGIGVLVENSQDIRLETCRLVNNSDDRRSQRGGGLYVGNSTVTLTNCWVSGNNLTAWNNYCYGNGVFVDGSSYLSVIGSVVTDNKSGGTGTLGQGGGLYVASGGSLDVRESVIRENTTGVSGKNGYGGGIYNAGMASLRNVLIVGNRSYLAASGSGVHAAGASSTTLVVNCTVADNLTGVYGLMTGGGLFAVSNSIVAGHSVADLSGFPADGGGVLSNVWYSCIEDGQNAGHQGCHSIDPLFVDRVHYHLQSTYTDGCYSNGYFSGGAWITAAGNSPVIDRGDTNSVYAREPAPNGGRINMGAYGNTEVASKTPTISATLPAITNPGAGGVGHRIATLRAEVTDEGGQTPDCSFEYWLDGSETTNTVPKGLTAGSFSYAMSGLTPGDTYHYRAYAENSAGTSVTAIASFTLHSANADLYVATNGNHTAATNWVTAYNNLDTALAIAEPGDTIHVAGGQTFSLGPLYNRGFSQVHPYNTVYLWENATNMTMIGGYEALPVQTPGTPDPEQWPTLLTRSSGDGRIMALRSSSNCVIRNITFTNGYLAYNVAPSTSIGGIGVLVENSQDIRLEACRMVNNRDDRRSHRGGGIYAANSSVTLSNCWVIGNNLMAWGNTCYGNGGFVDGTSYLRVIGSVVTNNYNVDNNNTHGQGGGFYVASGGRLDVEETVIRANTSGADPVNGYGGGIANAGTASLRNVLIVGNRSVSANSGGGIYATGASSTTLVVNCTVADNLGGIGLQWDGAGSFAVTNSILWGNGVDSTGGVTLAWSCYSNSTDHVSGGNNISTNPLFVNTTYYHLQSTVGNYTNAYFSGGGWGVSATDSPCLDAGDKASDESREPEPNGRRINLGAYGGTEVASKTFTVTGTIFVIR